MSNKMGDIDIDELRGLGFDDDDTAPVETVDDDTEVPTAAAGLDPEEQLEIRKRLRTGGDLSFDPGSKAVQNLLPGKMTYLRSLEIRGKTDEEIGELNRKWLDVGGGVQIASLVEAGSQFGELSEETIEAKRQLEEKWAGDKNGSLENLLNKVVSRYNRGKERGDSGNDDRFQKDIIKALSAREDDYDVIVGHEDWVDYINNKLSVTTGQEDFDIRKYDQPASVGD